MYFHFSVHTSDVFVVSCDVLFPRVANSFGADQGSHFLRVFLVAKNPALAHYDCVDVGVHLGVDKGDVIKQVNTPVLDCFHWGWATAEHSWDKKRRETGLRQCLL